MLRLKLALFPKRSFPAPLQLACDEPVFWLHGLVLALGPTGLITSPFQPLLPILAQALPLLLQIVSSSQAQLQCPRLQCGQHLLGDQFVKDTTCEALTGRALARFSGPPANIPQILRFAAVMHGHAPPAAPTDHQTAEQRRTLSWNAERLVARAV